MIRILTPAKLNLGLEILSRRDDGYHEIRTIFCAVSLFDKVTVTTSSADQVACLPAVDTPENLVSVALRNAREVTPELPGICVTVEKRIPAAAGLGGASSDAAATLLAISRLHPDQFRECSIAELAAQCGSDVPFFLHSGLALGEGRGEQLRRLPFVPIHAVIITPLVDIPDKTRAMFARIRPTDWTDGGQVASIAEQLCRGEVVGTGERLPNAFRQPLYDLFPDIQALAEEIESMLGRSVQVTGAGPSIFVLCSGSADALSVRRELSARVDPDQAHLHTVRSVSRVLITGNPDV
jgi:4-diphosphocytidyl-2-C-methyl-D-erythritol kinase